jgi:hypothetical protein
LDPHGIDARGSGAPLVRIVIVLRVTVTRARKGPAGAVQRGVT